MHVKWHSYFVLLQGSKSNSDESDDEESLSPVQEKARAKIRDRVESPKKRRESRQRRSRLTNEKQCIMALPSALYIKSMYPGGDDNRVPYQWRKTDEHLELFLQLNYEDYLAACGSFFSNINIMKNKLF